MIIVVHGMGSRIAGLDMKLRGLLMLMVVLLLLIRKRVGERIRGLIGRMGVPVWLLMVGVVGRAVLRQVWHMLPGKRDRVGTIWIGVLIKTRGRTRRGRSVLGSKGLLLLLLLLLV